MSYKDQLKKVDRRLKTGQEFSPEEVEESRGMDDKTQMVQALLDQFDDMADMAEWVVFNILEEDQIKMYLEEYLEILEEDADY